MVEAGRRGRRGAWRRMACLELIHVEHAVAVGVRLSKEASAARRLADEIVPKWSNATAANTMEYATSLKAVMVEGHGPVTGLLYAVSKMERRNASL